jgi:hypothetical protein
LKINVGLLSGTYLLKLAVQKSPKGRKPGSSCHRLHFDDAPVDNTEELEQTLQEY